MKCPFCKASNNHIKVVDTREVTDGIRRRRECGQCKQRFTTYERISGINLFVIKRDGRREEFDREKMIRSIRLACTKRPISNNKIEAVAQDIERSLFSLCKMEINGVQIGERVMDYLQTIDDVAYVRFASIYLRFQDVDSISEEIQQLQARKRREEELKNQIPLPISNS